MTNYRVTVTGALATDQDHVKLLCAIQKKNDVGGWDDLEGGPASIYLSTSEVLAVMRQDLTDEEKRAALLVQFRRQARALPILAGDQAVDQIEGLLPSGWPVTVFL